MAFQGANQQIQRSLYNRTKNDTRDKIINALMAARAENNTITESDLQYSAGKKRQFKMNYYPVVCDAEGSCEDNVCDTGRVLEPKQQIFGVNRCTASIPFRLNVDDIRLTDDDLSFSDHALAQIYSMIGGVRKGLASDVSALLVANAGCQPNGAETKALQLTDPANGAVRPLGLWTIEQTFEDAGMSNPYVIGGTDLFLWKKAIGNGGLNSFGQETGRMTDTNMFYDKVIDSTFADPTTGHIIAFDPQMLKFVTFSRNAGMFATDWNRLEDMDRQFKESKNGKIKGTFIDPVTGLMWDLDIRFQDCDEEHWILQLRLEWDIFFLPDYVCNIDCVNGIFHFTTCLPAETVCPTPEEPVIVTPSVFEFTPTGTYPKYIGDLTLGGQSSEPKVTVANIAQYAAALTAAMDGYNFTVSGSDIVYTGYNPISGTANDGTIVIEFEAATT